MAPRTFIQTTPIVNLEHWNSVNNMKAQLLFHACLLSLGFVARKRKTSANNFYDAAEI
jgi:hypothetical protein